MQTRTIPSGDGYAKLGKGENAYVKIIDITPDVNDYAGEDDDTDRQLKFIFQAKSAEEGTVGRIPAYFNSKITIRDDDEWSSNLGKLLKYAGVLEDVMRDVGLSEEKIEEIMDGEDLAYASDGDQNAELHEAVVTRLSEVDDLVLKAGTSFAGDDDDYSKVSDILERAEGVDVPMPDEDDDARAETGEEEEPPMVDSG